MSMTGSWLRRAICSSSTSVLWKRSEESQTRCNIHDGIHEWAARRAGRAISKVLIRARDTTQRSMKFTRCRRGAPERRLTQATAVPLQEHVNATQ